jgi:DNA-binding IclR family transcriptional regulator
MSAAPEKSHKHERMLDLIEALSGCAVNGVSNKALAEALGCSPTDVSRDMPTLINKGWARKDSETGHFHPTARMGQVFGRILADINKAETRLADIKHNFTRGMG